MADAATVSARDDDDGAAIDMDNAGGEGDFRTAGEVETTPTPAPPGPQAYRSVFNETVAPPGGPLARVVRPPVDIPPESKRAQLIEDAEVDLEQDMDELERAVHAYNVDFQRRIDKVKARGRVLETQVRGEYEAMEESMNQLQHAFTRGFQSAFLALEQKTLAHFARVEAQDVAAQERAIHDVEADARQFFYASVPAILESLQGAITRKLEKNHETFDIENAKTQKRERKTLAAMAANETRAARDFAAERARRAAKFRERDEEFHHTMRVDNRASEAQHARVVDALASLRAQLAEERRVRQCEDLDVLNKLGEAFHRLQASIVENLGEQQQQQQQQHRDAAA